MCMLWKQNTQRQFALASLGHPQGGGWKLTENGKHWTRTPKLDDWETLGYCSL